MISNWAANNYNTHNTHITQYMREVFFFRIHADNKAENLVPEIRLFF